jgi:hypothetical protein
MLPGEVRSGGAADPAPTRKLRRDRAQTRESATEKPAEAPAQPPTPPPPPAPEGKNDLPFRIQPLARSVDVERTE